MGPKFRVLGKGKVFFDDIEVEVRSAKKIASQGGNIMPSSEKKGRPGFKIYLFAALLVLVLPVAAPAAGNLLLDTYSSWRMSFTLKPPVIESIPEPKPVILNLKWADLPTAPVAAEWNKLEMDDSGWLRGPVTVAPNVSMLDRIYLRGVFTVPYPQSAGDLTLTAEYHGGIIVYINGEEVGRNNIAKDKRNDPKAPVFAENYPEEAFVTEKGIWLGPSGAKLDGKIVQSNEESKRRMALWVREATVKIPAKHLKKGANVVCIEVVRAPYGKAFNKVDQSKKGEAYEILWPTCRILKLELNCAMGAVPNPGRPKGMQVWNADILAGDYDRDFGNPAEPLRSVKITGPRNGIFSGKIMVGSTNSIEGLSAVAGELKGPAVIPATALKVRYGVPWGKEAIANQTYHAQPSPYLTSTTFMGGISNKPLKEYPLGKEAGNSPAGAVAPVWITVNIPKEAPPGIYTGSLTVKINGEKAVVVPVELKVLAFTLPDQQDYRTWVDLIQSPDTLTLEYNVPHWSDKHFEMIAESFSLISGTGTRIVYIPAIAHTNLGNAESMIRWINKGNNKYDWDFSVMDKYLDIAQKNLGNPKITVLQVWEVYMRSNVTAQKRFQDFQTLGCPQVTFIDPVTKKTELGNLPPLSDASSKKTWKELLEQVQLRLKKRGLEKSLMIGMFCDAIPMAEDVQFFADIAPKLTWVQQGHGLFDKIQGITDVGYNATVWGGFRFGDGCKQTNQKDKPVTESLKGWNNPRLDAVFERNVNLDTFPSTRWYFFPETGITSELRGIGRIGADYWKFKDKNGRRANFAHDNYREGNWGGTSIALNLCNPVLSPGQEGPEATNRLIALIEGVEACEARIYLEKALMDSGSKSRMGTELAKRCQAVLDERLYDMWRALSNLEISTGTCSGYNMWRWTAGVAGHNYFLGSGWQKQAEKLFTLAGEAEQKIGKKK